MQVSLTADNIMELVSTCMIVLEAPFPTSSPGEPRKTDSDRLHRVSWLQHGHTLPPSSSSSSADTAFAHSALLAVMRDPASSVLPRVVSEYMIGSMADFSASASAAAAGGALPAAGAAGGGGGGGGGDGPASGDGGIDAFGASPVLSSKAPPAAAVTAAAPAPSASASAGLPCTPRSLASSAPATVDGASNTSSASAATAVTAGTPGFSGGGTGLFSRSVSTPSSTPTTGFTAVALGGAGTPPGRPTTSRSSSTGAALWTAHATSSSETTVGAAEPPPPPPPPFSHLPTLLSSTASPASRSHSFTVSEMGGGTREGSGETANDGGGRNGGTVSRLPMLRGWVPGGGGGGG
ncbi:unnamed protein product, partial [Hapterophycus canaliculatus]